MKKLLFFLCCPLFLLGQNTVFVDPPNYKEGLPDFKKELPASLHALLNPKDLLANGLAAFSNAHLSNYSQKIRFGNSFMPLYSSTWYPFIQEPWNREKKEVRLDSLKTSFFSNKAFWEPSYALAMPFYQKRFKAMSVPEAEAILQKLNEGLDYAKNFDLAKEQADWAADKSRFAHSKGKFRAFIYRRIVSKELSKQECVSWIARIIKDLQKAMPEKRTDFDHYVIGRLLGGDYYWGYTFDPKASYKERHYLIFKKEGSSFKALGKAEDRHWFQKQEYLGNQLIIPFEKANGGQELHFFNKVGETQWNLDRIAIASALDKVQKLNFAKALALHYKDGGIDILYHPSPENLERISIKGGYNQLLELNNWGYWVITRADEKGELIHFKDRFSAPKIQRSELPKGIRKVKNIQSNAWSIFGAPPSSPLLSMNYQNQNWLWHLDGETWHKIPTEDFYTKAEVWSNKRYLVTKDEKEGVLGQDGQLLMPVIYKGVYPLKEHYMAVAEQEGTFKVAFFDAAGKALTPFKFDVNIVVSYDPETFEEIQVPNFAFNPKAGTVVLKESGDKDEAVPLKEAVYNHYGKEVIPPKYDLLQEVYTDSLAVAYYIVVKDMDHSNPEETKEALPKGKYGVINSLGKRVIPFKYQSIKFLDQAWVYDEKNFEMTLEPTVKPIQPHFIVKDKKGRTLFLDLKGKKIENPLKGVKNLYDPEGS